MKKYSVYETKNGRMSTLIKSTVFDADNLNEAKKKAMQWRQSYDTCLTIICAKSGIVLSIKYKWLNEWRDNTILKGGYVDAIDYTWEPSRYF